MPKEAKRGDKQTQAYIRRQAVKSVIEKNLKVKDAAELFGVAVNTVYRWVKDYKDTGSECLKSKTRGRPKGNGRHLNDEQCKIIRKIITEKDPEQLKMPFALWTRKCIQELIENEFGVFLPIRTVGDYLKRWGFTPQRPKKRSYEQQPKAVQHWLDTEYPAIKKAAIEEDAEIHWGDETGCTNSISNARSYAPKGQTPTLVQSTKKKIKINMISSISNQGKIFFDIHEGKINSAEFIAFMKKLIRSIDRKVYFIVDNLPQHHSHMVQKWLKENKNKIKIFYLPSYSPELNPDEYMNGDLKRGMNKKKMPKSNEELKNNAKNYVQQLSMQPEKIKSFFQHPKVKYAS